MNPNRQHIDVPVSAFSSLHVYVDHDGDRLCCVGASLQVNGIEASHSHVGHRDDDPANWSVQVWIQEDTDRQALPFDFGVGGAYFYIGRDAADVVGAFLSGAGVPFGDWREEGPHIGPIQAVGRVSRPPGMPPLRDALVRVVHDYVRHDAYHPEHLSAIYAIEAKFVLEHLAWKPHAQRAAWEHLACAVACLQDGRVIPVHHFDKLFPEEAAKEQA